MQFPLVVHPREARRRGHETLTVRPVHREQHANSSGAVFKTSSLKDFFSNGYYEKLKTLQQSWKDCIVNPLKCLLSSWVSMHSELNSSMTIYKCEYKYINTHYLHMATDYITKKLSNHLFIFCDMKIYPRHQRQITFNYTVNRLHWQEGAQTPSGGHGTCGCCWTRGRTDLAHFCVISLPHRWAFLLIHLTYFPLD